MTEDTPTSTLQSTADGASHATGGTSVQERAIAVANDRPEAAVGAAFAGGLLVALILKRLAH